MTEVAGSVEKTLNLGKYSARESERGSASIRKHNGVCVGRIPDTVVNKEEKKVALMGLERGCYQGGESCKICVR